MTPQLRLLGTASAICIAFGVGERAYWVSGLDAVAVLVATAALLTLAIWHRPLRRGFGQLTERGGASA